MFVPLLHFHNYLLFSNALTQDLSLIIFVNDYFVNECLANDELISFSSKVCLKNSFILCRLHSLIG